MTNTRLPLAIVLLAILAATPATRAAQPPRDTDPSSDTNPAPQTEAPRAAQPERPNILFIAIDDLNDWVGHLGGHPMAKTPNIDALASRGTTFTNAHCQAPICNPSRTSLMTGLRPSNTGIYGLSPWFRKLPEFRNVVTLPQYLKRHAGYTTYSAGKVYHGGYGRNQEEFDVLGPPANAGPFPQKKLVTTPFGNHRLVDWGTFPHQDQQKGDWKVASWAEKQLADMPEGPFFLSVGFFLPHVPCFATPKWFELYPDDDSVLPAVLDGDRDDTPRFSWYLHWYLPEVRLKWLRENDQWRNLVRSYLACTSFVDSQVGRVLEALERNGYADNTIVVLWSDHGWHLGEKDITGKNSLWHESTRVPLVFAGPGVTAGQTCHRPAELLDIYPTLVDLLDLPANGKLEGHSLVPQLHDAEAPRRWPAITTHNHDNHSVVTEDWRYIQYADGSEELYDTRRDPRELTNLAGEARFADVIARHRQMLPPDSRKPAPGSRSRILTYEDGVVTWEGRRVPPDAPIPGVETSGREKR